MESENKDFDLDKYLYDCDIEDVPNGLEIVNQSYLITFGDLLEK